MPSYGLDGWVTEITPSGIPIVTVDRGIVRAAEDDEYGAIDPHYWLSSPMPQSPKRSRTTYSRVSRIRVPASKRISPYS